MKPFFITIDTEGDNLWDDPIDIKTENVLWMPRFQEVCEKYGFIPIWLTDYEIACDDRFVSYMKDKAQKGLCEIGIHVHARNTPPIVKLEGEVNGGAYLIEYPRTIMHEKIIVLKHLLESNLGINVVTHRAGRWALNQIYIDELIECGLKYDCSVTPGKDWTSFVGITPGSHGADYSAYKNKKQYITHSNGMDKIKEYPTSILKNQKLLMPDEISLYGMKRAIYHWIKKADLWLRPNGNNLNEMKYVLDYIVENDIEYAEFMIHSSELMPNGSPATRTQEMYDKLFGTIEEIFSYAQKLGFVGHTFESWENYKNENRNNA